MPAEGGDAVQLTTDGGSLAFESPDRLFVYYLKDGPASGGGPHGIWRMPAEGGAEVQVHDRGEFPLLAVQAQGIFYIDRDSEPYAVELLDFTTGKVSRVAVLEVRPVRWGFSVSPDGRWILYIKNDVEYDIMLVENFR
jgi:hypothetical protein